MDIMSLFGRSSQPNANTNNNSNNQNQNQNNNNNNQNQNQNATPGNIPPGKGVNNKPPENQNDSNNNQNNNDTNNNNKSPLDQFAELWKNDTNNSGNDSNKSFFNVDQKKLMEAAGKVDFAKVIKPEQLQAISKGGDEGIAAFTQAMNAVSQTVYAQSAFATSKIVEQALAKAKEDFEAGIPALIKKHAVNDSSRSKNPALSHPAIQPLVEGIQAQLQQKFPNATTAELEDMTSKYFEHVSGVFKGSSQEQQQNSRSNKGSRGETDWESFLQTGSNS